MLCISEQSSVSVCKFYFHKKNKRIIQNIFRYEIQVTANIKEQTASAMATLNAVENSLPVIQVQIITNYLIT